MFERDSSEERATPEFSLGKTALCVLREMAETVIPALIIALLIQFFLVQSALVFGQSMEPNLHPGQRLIVEKVSCRLHAPNRGDVVLVDVEDSEIPLVKRVVGLPGETVEIKDNRVFIDGRLLEEPYLRGVFQRDFGPVEVRPAHVFVLGDNRAASRDSRYFGPVGTDKIIGRAWLSYWPIEVVGPVK